MEEFGGRAVVNALNPPDPGSGSAEAVASPACGSAEVPAEGAESEGVLVSVTERFLTSRASHFWTDSSPRIALAKV